MGLLDLRHSKFNASIAVAAVFLVVIFIKIVEQKVAAAAVKIAVANHFI
jgi:hypothetical protein